MRGRSKVLVGLGVGLSWVGLGLAVSACSGDDNATFTIVQGDGGQPTIVKLSDGGTAVANKLLISSAATAPNAMCSAGGTTISVGYDLNANGTLDPSEVTSSQEVCNAVAGGTDGGSGSPQILTKISYSPSDDMCANGGTIVQTGADTNGNGILDPGEVTSTNEICGGGFATILSITTAIPVGSDICPAGGTETQSGPDNGANGGTAGDGILQTGEITSTVNVCTTPASGGYSVQPFAPPAPVANQQSYAINLNGGTSATADGGGAGGSFSITKYGSSGGHIKFFKTGQANASFTMPAYTPNYGTGKVLDVSTTNSPLTIQTAPAIGAFYFKAGELVFDQDADHTNVAVTGVHVEAGQTLNVPGGGGNQISVVNDIVVEGTINVEQDANGNGESLSMLSSSGNFVGGAAGVINAGGATGAAGAQGGGGGSVTVAAIYVYNQATINASGGAGGAVTGGGAENGGNGGSIALYATSSVGDTNGDDDDDDDDDDQGNGTSLNSALYNMGALTANGGAATLTTPSTGGGQGGANGYIQLSIHYGSLYNSGAVTARGGEGAGSGGGGSGNSINFSKYGGGADSRMYLSGAIDGSGGDGDLTCTSTNCGSGGTAANVSIQINGGSLVSSGALTVNGGASASKNNGTGAGGQIDVSLYGGNNGVTEDTVAYGNAIFSGNISANGGAPMGGGFGGTGGSFSLYEPPTSAPQGQEVQFLGYTNINANGGDAVGASNSVSRGGRVSAHINSSSNNNVRQATGSVINYADISVHGGAGLATSATSVGGNGGSIDFESDGPNSPTDDDDGQFIINAGALNVSGGNGSARGGSTGSVQFQAYDGIVNNGAITGTGGSTTVASGVAGGYNNAPLAYFYTQGVLTNTGAINFSAGNATIATGTGSTTGGSYNNDGDIEALTLYGGNGLTNSGAITASGGSSVTNNGGAGANITFTSGGIVNNTGVLTSLGGASTGGTAGAAGIVTINNVVQP